MSSKRVIQTDKPIKKRRCILVMDDSDSSSTDNDMRNDSSCNSTHSSGSSSSGSSTSGRVATFSFSQSLNPLFQEFYFTFIFEI